MRYLAGMFTAAYLRVATAIGLCIAILAIACVGSAFAQSHAVFGGETHDAFIAAPRWDTHPIVLAFVQLAGVLAAIVVFPRPGVARLAWLEEDVRTFFRRSYRASFFGS
jgi:hypothetical protein